MPTILTHSTEVNGGRPVGIEVGLVQDSLGERNRVELWLKRDVPHRDRLDSSNRMYLFDLSLFLQVSTQHPSLAGPDIRTDLAPRHVLLEVVVSFTLSYPTAVPCRPSHTLQPYHKLRLYNRVCDVKYGIYITMYLVPCTAIGPTQSYRTAR